MSKTMIILVPSRARPDNAMRLLNRFNETRTGHTRMQIFLDRDDPELAGYMNLLPSLTASIGDRLRLGGTLNKFAVALEDHYDIIGFVGDDVYPQTEGWDTRIIEAMTPGGIVYTNDGHQGQNLPTAVFMDSRIIKALGFMVQPGMTHLFIDNYWYELGKRLGTLTYLEDVYLEHLHPFAGKAETDQTYEEANSPAVWNADEAILKNLIDSGGLDEYARRIELALG